MDAVQGVAHDAVFLAVALDGVEQVAAVAVADVLERDGFVAAGDEAVEVLEDGDEFFNEGFAFLVDALAVFCHHLFEESHDVVARFLVSLEQGIALLEGFVVGGEGGHVFGIVL